MARSSREQQIRARRNKKEGYFNEASGVVTFAFLGLIALSAIGAIGYHIFA